MMARVKIKSTMLRFMRKMMISCNEATYIITQKNIIPISMKRRMNLRLHLMGCKYCRRYNKQVKIILGNIRTKENNIKNEILTHRLSNSQKLDLQRVINNKIKSV